MVFERIVKLQQDYTDQYVMVDEARPELGRFRGLVGQVRTVNMNGRALVEFAAEANVGWYDIELDYLKVVPKPEPKAAAKKAAAKPKADGKPKPKPAAKEGLSPLELARMQGAAQKETPAGEEKKPSTAEILAAARGTSSSPPTATGPGDPAERDKMSTADILAAARKPQGDEKTEEKEPAKALPPDRSKMSVAEMIAAAKAEKSGGGASAPPAEAKSAPAKPKEPAAKPSTPATSAPAGEGKPMNRSKMSVAEMIAAAKAEKSGGAPAGEAPVAEEEAAAQPAKETAPVAEEAPPPATPKGELPTTTDEIIAYCRRVDAS